MNIEFKDGGGVFIMKQSTTGDSVLVAIKEPWEYGTYAYTLNHEQLLEIREKIDLYLKQIDMLEL